MAVLFKAYRDANGEIVYVRENSYQDLNIGTGLTRAPGMDKTTSNDELTNETVPGPHTHVASEITDFDTEVANNTAVTANTAKRSYPLADENKLANIEANAKDDQNADEVPFDNTGSDLTSTNLEAAVKEVRTSVGTDIAAHEAEVDPHPIYLNDTRGDVRYYTKTQLDSGQLDIRYFTESELNAGALDTRYYTETELNSGALDTRYYTEGENDTLLNAKQDISEKGQPLGYASLDANGHVPSNQLSPTVIGETFVVADIPARDALVVGGGVGEISDGDVVIVNDASADPMVDSGGATYRWDGAAYQKILTPDAPVQSVNGQTGIVNLNTDDVSEGSTNQYFTQTRVSANTDVLANTAHRNITTGGNPHGTSITETIAADPGTDITTAELEQLTDNSDAGSLHNHDSQYYTETELDGGQLDTRYYTQTQLDNGQLDTRYYTETETDALLADKVTGPASATDSDFAQFDGTTGKLIKGGISLVDEDDMVSDSNTAVPTQQSTKAFVQRDHIRLINQPGHGFSLTNNIPLPAFLNGSTVELAQADDENTLSAFFITRIIDANNFEIRFNGIHEVPSHGLTVGNYYYLDNSIAGEVTIAEPLNSLDDVVFYVLDGNNLVLIDNRPIDRESLEKYLIKTSNTNTSTNINEIAPQEVPLTGTTEVNENNYYNVVGNGIEITRTRSYKLIANVHYTSTGQRVALQGRFYINGNPVGAITSTGYIRSSTGHDEASLHLTEYFALTAGDVVTFRTNRESTVSTPANLAQVGSSNMMIEAR
jgi:hypothetical protein